MGWQGGAVLGGESVNETTSSLPGKSAQFQNSGGVGGERGQRS